MAGQQKSGSDGSIELDLRALYFAFRERRTVIALFVLAALIAALAYLFVAPKLYRSQAIVQIEQAEPKMVKFEGVGAQDFQNSETLKTMEMNFSNWVLLARVAKRPELKLTPAAFGMPERAGQPKGDAEMLGRFAKCVSVRLVRGTRLITIGAEVADPTVAGMIPNLLIAEHRKMVSEEHEQMSAEANRFLSGQVESLKTKLDRSKMALQKYREDTKAVALEDSRNTVDASLRDLNAKLTEAKAARLRLESDYAQVQRIGKNVPEQLQSLQSIAANASVLEQKKILAAQEAELANRSRRYLPKHPRYIEAKARLDELKAGHARAMLDAADGLATALQAAQINEQKIEEATHQQEAKSLELGRLAIGYGALVREVDSDNALYLNLLNRLKETDVLRGIQPGKGGLPILAEPHGATAESFRTLRTSLALLGEQGQQRTYLFTSAVQGEGKSFTATNFAVSLAQQGLRTLIIDADLRLPKLGKIFFNQPPDSGLADVLLADLAVGKAWRESDIPNLSVMTAGNRPHNCAEMLSGQGFDRMLRQAQTSFDAIVVDSAPINAVSDTLLLVKLVQSVCLVVHSASTPRKAVAHAVRKLREAGAPMAGLVLNFVPAHSGGGYHYHYSQGAYGEGVYGAPRDARR